MPAQPEQQEHHRRPDHVELLFDGQCPQVTDRAVAVPHMPVGLHVEPVRAYKSAAPTASRPCQDTGLPAVWALAR